MLASSIEIIYLLLSNHRENDHGGGLFKNYGSSAWFRILDYILSDKLSYLVSFQNDRECRNIQVVDQLWSIKSAQFDITPT